MPYRVHLLASSADGARRRDRAAGDDGPGLATGLGGRRRGVHVDVRRLRDRLQLRRVLRLDGRGLRHRQGGDGPHVLGDDGVVLRPRSRLRQGRRSLRAAAGPARRRRVPRRRPAPHVTGPLDLARLPHLRRRGRCRRGVRLRTDGRHGRRVVRASPDDGPRRRRRRHRHRHAGRGADLRASDRRPRLAHGVRRARSRRRAAAAGGQPRRLAPAGDGRPGTGRAAPGGSRSAASWSSTPRS